MKIIVSYKLAFCCTVLSVITLFPASFLAAMDLVSTLVILLPICLFLRSSILTNKTVFICGTLAGFAYLSLLLDFDLDLDLAFCVLDLRLLGAFYLDEKDCSSVFD